MRLIIQLPLIYLAVYFLISGLDDLSVDLRVLWGTWIRRLRRNGHSLPELSDLRLHPQKRIAIMVPLWRESNVIRAMVETNLHQLEYRNLAFFLGVYPNDEPTIVVARSLAASHANVHVVVCSRPGPTSKADCLNCIYRHIEGYESIGGSKFDLVMLHDAEDLLHPTSLALVNWFSDSYGMVQVPVLPFPTGLKEWVHGVYCDEFAEFLSRDLRLREYAGAFLPSNGVGTAIRREHLSTMRDAQNGILFDSECLTEDYELGMKLAGSGCRQIFLPLTRKYGDLLATREYFPRTFASAVRQRSRWISGQCLQSWERHGWPLDRTFCYWFWRDRKGLWGNLLSFLAVLMLGLSGFAWLAPETFSLGPWLWLAGSLPGAEYLYSGCAALALERALVRVFLVSRIYGLPFALAAPLRMVLSTFINARATVSALHRFARARSTRKRLRWAKTEHAFPFAVAHQSGAPEFQVAGATQSFASFTASSTKESASGIAAATARYMNQPLVEGLRPVRLSNGEWVLAVSPRLSSEERDHLASQHHARIVFLPNPPDHIHPESPPSSSATKESNAAEA